MRVGDREGHAKVMTLNLRERQTGVIPALSWAWSQAALLGHRKGT